jgi:hypothetical protein
MDSNPRQIISTGNLFRSTLCPRADYSLNVLKCTSEPVGYVSALGVQLWISCMGRHPYQYISIVASFWIDLSVLAASNRTTDVVGPMYLAAKSGTIVAGVL